MLILCILLVANIATAQIDDIKKKADQNKKENNNESKDNKAEPENYSENGGSGGNPCADACAGAATEFCAEIFVGFISEVIGAHHRFIMDEINDPTKLSFSFSPFIGVGGHQSNNSGLHKYVNALPHIKGRWGMFSMDFRFNYLMEFENISTSAYKTWDWQIFIMNFQPDDQFMFSFGNGIHYEPYTKKMSHSLTFGFTVSNETHSQFAVLEGRMVSDYNKSLPFGEINLSHNIQFFSTDQIAGYFTLAGIYQNYYVSHDIWQLGAGFSFYLR